MDIYCCVPGCPNDEKTGLNFYKFPTSKFMILSWLEEIEKGTGNKFDMSTFNSLTARVCQVHFQDNDFMVDKDPRTGKKLIEKKPYAIPAVFKYDSLKLDPEMQAKCRTCLKRIGAVHIKEYLPHLSVTISQAVQRTFDYNFALQPSFPQLVCHRCYNFIVAAFYLKKQILRNDSYLYNKYSSQHNVTQKSDLFNEREFEKKREAILAVGNYLKDENGLEGPEMENESQSEEAETENQAEDYGEITTFTITEIKQEPELIVEDQEPNDMETEDLPQLTTDETINTEDQENVMVIVEPYSDEEENVKNDPPIVSPPPPSINTRKYVRTYENKCLFAKKKMKEPPGPLPLDINRMLEIALEREQKEKYEMEVRLKVGNERCRSCSFKGRNIFETMKHVEESSEGNCIDAYETVQCFICFKKFLFNEKKLEHLSRDHKETDKTCEHCGFICKNIFAYENHVRRHLMYKLYVCGVCGWDTTSQKSYKDHLKSHQNSTGFACDICGYFATSKCGIEAHMDIHKESRRHWCSKCPNRFKLKSQLRNHFFVIHKYAPDGCYWCPKCNYCYLVKHEYKCHIGQCQGKTKNSKQLPKKARRIPRTELDERCKIIDLDE